MLLEKALYSSRVTDQKLSFCLTTSEIFTTGEFCWCQCLPSRCHFSCKVYKKSFWAYVLIMVDYFLPFFLAPTTTQVWVHIWFGMRKLLKQVSGIQATECLKCTFLNSNLLFFFFDVSHAHYMYDILSPTTMIGA